MGIVIPEERVAEAVDLMKGYGHIRDKYAGNPPGTVGWDRYQRYATAVLAVREVLDKLGIEVD